MDLAMFTAAIPMPRALTSNRDYEPLLTVRQAAAALHQSPKTIWGWVRKGVFPVVRVGPYRSIRIKASVIALHRREQA